MRLLMMTATTKVAGANRQAKARPKMPTCIDMSFRSIMGPTTRKASRAVSENDVKLAATNASASEQMESTTASSASPRTASTGFPEIDSIHSVGIATFIAAAASPPTTRKPPACRKS